MPDEQVATLILRFRDLGQTGFGETIKLHQDEISVHKYTWWGWWSKFGEQVPVELFTHLLERMASKPLELYLLDSGQHLLYRAVCSDIHWHGRDLAPSPEPESTPEYYRKRDFLAWFRLSEIGPEVPAEKTLRRFTSVRVDAFFRSVETKFGEYYGKQVKDAQELIDQNRTIWFVRDYDKDTDRSYDSPRQTADTRAPFQEPFPSIYVSSHNRTLLWLSDLHFGHHAFPESGDLYQRNLALALEQDLRDNHQEVAGALISGDFTWRAATEEFDQAVTFIRQVQSWSTLEPHQFLCCPGNHDLRFSDEPWDKNRPIEATPAAARAAYDRFYKELYRHEPNEYLSCGRRFLLGNHLPVEVVSLNTSLLRQEANVFQGHGLVGREQLEDAANGLGWQPRPGRNADHPTGLPFPRAFRILVLHHHMVPVTFREVPYPEHRTSVLFDAEAIVRWIVEREVDLVLHGHMHEPFITRMARPVPNSKGMDWHEFHVLGLGSTGVKRDHIQGQELHNSYGLLEFGHDSLQLSIRRIHPQGIQTDQAQQSSIEIPYNHLHSKP